MNTDKDIPLFAWIFIIIAMLLGVLVAGVVVVALVRLLVWMI